MSKTFPQPDPAPTPPTRRRWWAIAWVVVSSVALVAALSAAVAMWLVGRTTYTDGRGLRVEAAGNELRQVLWTPAVPLVAEEDPGKNRYEPSVSAAGDEMFFVRGRPGEGADLFTARRTDAGWTTPEPLTTINTAADELGPALTADARYLLFYSDREGGEGQYDLWAAARDEDGAWQEPFNLGPRVNSPFNDYSPAPSPDGRLFFSSDRAAAERLGPEAWRATIRSEVVDDYDLWVAETGDQVDARSGDTATEVAAPGALVYQEPRAVGELNTSAREGACAVSPTGDFLYFTSNRSGGAGGLDLWRARLTLGSDGELFIGEAQNLGLGVNSQHNEADPALTEGGFRLLFSSDRPITGGQSSRATAETLRLYDLFTSDSREVYGERLRGGAGLLAWHWWLLIAALVVLVALGLTMLDTDNKKLNLLQRCLLASLLLHLLLAVYMGFVRALDDVLVAMEVRPAAMEVAMSPEADTELMERLEVRETLADVADLPEPEVSPLTPRAEVVELTPAEVREIEVEPPPTVVRPASLEVAVARVAEREPEPMVVERPMVEPRPMTPSVQVVVAARMPSVQPVRQETSEAEAPTAEAAPTQRSVVEEPVPSAEPERVTVEPVNAMPLASASPLLVLVEPEAKPPVAAERRPVAEAMLPATPSLAEPVRVASVSRATPVVQATEPREASPAVTDTTAELTRRQAATEPTQASQPERVAALATAAKPSRQPSDAPPELPRLTSVPPQPATIEPIRARPTLPMSTTPAQPVQVRPLATPARVVAHRDATQPGEDAAAEAVDAPMLQRSTTPGTAAAADAADRPARVAVGTPTATATRSLPPALPGELPRTARLPARSPTLTRAPVTVATLAPIAPVTAGLPPTLSHRTWQRRQELLREMGGTPETEDAVARALAWLARNQEEDGRWTRLSGNTSGGRGAKDDHDHALTGLAMLAFLASGHAPNQPGPYADTVARAANLLVERQKDDGDLRGQGDMYDQGIAAFALAEASAMSGDVRLRDAAIKAADFIEAAQDDKTGGWRYKPGGGGDTSVLGWQVMALHSAEGLGRPISQRTHGGAMKWLDTVSRDNLDVLAEYVPGKGATAPMTAEAAFCRIMLGQTMSGEQVAAVNKMLLSDKPGGKKSGGDKRNYYLIYYGSLAMMQIQGPAWDEWNAAMRTDLLASQQREGDADGAWPDRGRWADKGGSVYSTSLAALSLQVYYRYLPMSKRLGEGNQPQMNTDERR